jgi:hypothetical protein
MNEVLAEKSAWQEINVNKRMSYGYDPCQFITANYWDMKENQKKFTSQI